MRIIECWGRGGGVRRGEGYRVLGGEENAG